MGAQNGGGIPNQTHCDDFAAFTNTIGLVHMHTQGAEYTWSNRGHGRRHIAVHLDGVIKNLTWLSIWSLSLFISVKL